MSCNEFAKQIGNVATALVQKRTGIMAMGKAHLASVATAKANLQQRQTLHKMLSHGYMESHQGMNGPIYIYIYIYISKRPRRPIDNLGPTSEILRLGVPDCLQAYRTGGLNRIRNRASNYKYEIP